MVKPANFGHFFMAIDPELFLPPPEFTARVDRLIEQTKAGDRAEGVEEILIPGESELRARERSLKEGVPLRPSTYQALRKYRSESRAGHRTDDSPVEHVAGIGRDPQTFDGGTSKCLNSSRNTFSVTTSPSTRKVRRGI